MEGVNLFRGVWGTPYLDPHRGCYLRRILGGNHYNPHYGPPMARPRSNSGGSLPSSRLGATGDAGL